VKQGMQASTKYVELHAHLQPTHGPFPWQWCVTGSADPPEYWFLSSLAHGLSFTKWGARSAARRACRALAKQHLGTDYEHFTYEAWKESQ
jgi:hypothetical protein